MYNHSLLVNSDDNDKFAKLYNNLLAGIISIIIKPHRSYTTYVDAAYYYRPSSVVCRSVSISFTLVSPAKTAGPIEMPFGLWTRVGPQKHVLDGAQIPHAKGQLLAERTCPAMPNDILP